MQVMSSGSEHFESEAEDPHARVLAIEEEIEELSEYAERCRKGMQISRGAIVAGALLLAGSVTGMVGGYGALAAIGGFAAVIGGIVWLGANKSSGEEARAKLERARAERVQAIDALRLQRLN